MQESHLPPAQSERYIYTSVCTTNRTENKGSRVDKRMEKQRQQIKATTSWDLKQRPEIHINVGNGTFSRLAYCREIRSRPLLQTTMTDLDKKKGYTCTLSMWPKEIEISPV